ncbi:MAG: aminopeptidase [Anaerolineales bacterium]|nr:aminopeptidase [Anaerolineales bacterium]
MNDPRIEKLAQVLVDYSVAIQPGDRVMINAVDVAAPLALAVYGRVLQAGGYPYTVISLSEIGDVFYRYASEEQLKYIHAPQRMLYETYDAMISIWGDVNTKSLSNVDPQRLVLRNQAQSELMQVFLKRVAEGNLRWVGTAYPTTGYAQDAEMSLREYEDFLFGACLPEMDDPVGYWQRFSARQQKIVDWLAGKERLRVIGPETDLRMSIAGRKFINCDGHENMPDGEVFTGPVEDSVEGYVHFSYPTIYQGREVTGVRLWFEGGRVVRATASKNEDFLLQILDTDAGARSVGEFAIGTNDGITRFTREILFDEKINGSFHMALGASLPESGGLNQSAIHWDMICDLRQGGEIWVDDQLLYKDGNFVIDFG